MIEQFMHDVDKGLSASPKSLSSKYFYDKRGSELFVEIMNLPEYYLTNSEFEIFKTQSHSIIKAFGIDSNDYFELIELGAGDGTKTKELLKVLLSKGYTLEYLPIDISKDALIDLKNNLKEELPKLKVNIKHDTYFDTLKELKDSKHNKVILFLGSNIGNMTDAIAEHFMLQLSDNLNPGDKVLLGVDLIKSKSIILPAYNDSKGVTKAFNLNLLQRINNELGGNFKIENWEHMPSYDETIGIARSAIKSKIDQNVHIEHIGKTFCFKKNELIETEISRKYNDAILDQILKRTKFSIFRKFTDSKTYFCNYLLVRNE